MKKGRIAVIACILLVLLAYPMIHFANNHIAKKLENRLLECPLPPNTQIIESTSVAGKMLGNGNGMQWFGILLVKSNLDEKQLSEWYYREMEIGDGDELSVTEQETRYVFEFGNVLFAKKEDFDGCYQIRLCGNLAVGTETSVVISLLNSDLRGH